MTMGGGSVPPPPPPPPQAVSSSIERENISRLREIDSLIINVRSLIARSTLVDKVFKKTAV